MILLSHITTLVAKIIDRIDQNITTAIIIIGCREKCRRKTINSDHIVGMIEYMLRWISMTREYPHEFRIDQTQHAAT